MTTTNMVWPEDTDYWVDEDYIEDMLDAEEYYDMFGCFDCE